MALPKKLPHMNGAKKMTAPGEMNLCVHVSAGFVLDVPGSELVFGTFRAATDEEALDILLAHGKQASREPMIHAWAEWQGKVWSPTTMRVFPREMYYELNGASDIKKLSRPALLKLSREFGLSRHLRLHVPHKCPVSFASTLCEAAGKAFRDDPTGALLPPLEETA
jgi:hypothetical protein